MFRWITPILNISRNSIQHYNTFSRKHIGIREDDRHSMLKILGQSSLKELVKKSTGVDNYCNLNLPNAIPEEKALTNLEKIMNKNKDSKSLIGLGYHNSYLPNPIRRHILENPKWYTAYIPYQSEISQGRLESQYNFQTLIKDLTGLPVSNASLLDEASAAGEVFSMCLGLSRKSKLNKDQFLVSDTLHPQTLEILKAKAHINNCNLLIVDFNSLDLDQLDKDKDRIFGIMFQYPDTYGEIKIPKDLIQFGQSNKIPIASSCDILSLTQLVPPGELGIDICFGTAQRFGVPMWFGGPHPAYLATTNKFIRYLPGRIIGKSVDSCNAEAYRIGLQTREQHIRKEKATSNICTSQSLLTNVVAMYGMYHGADGLKEIYDKIHLNTQVLKKGLEQMYICVDSNMFFDTLLIDDMDSKNIYESLAKAGYLIRYIDETHCTITLDETHHTKDLITILNIIKKAIGNDASNFSKCRIDRMRENINDTNDIIPQALKRTTPFLEDSVFKDYQSETELMRYIYRLSAKDYTLCEGMIPLGSCTMKLNSVGQLSLLTHPKVTNIHPYSPKEFVSGYMELIEKTGDSLKEITGMAGISFQSNAGSMGEYGGLLMIKKYLDSKGELDRKVCLIPKSAHGTNSASATIANLDVVFYDDLLTLEEFEKMVEKHSDDLAALMITYPGTNGIFTDNIRDICDIIHQNGGLVYMDGTNMNAMVGILKPGELGADVCHLNLHKTFCIPHGGGGPGMGPIVCNEKLIDYLPNNIFQDTLSDKSIGMITSSLWSSASLLTIPYMYINSMGKEGLVAATETAILNANYLKESLKDSYTINDVNEEGYVGHEFIINVGKFKQIGITEGDISKRLIDYGFHPPTMSWPRGGVLMFEPTESESKNEIDRLIVALKSIRQELEEIEDGLYPRENNVIKNAPHNMEQILNWNHCYSIDKACFPVESLRKNKFWPSVGRVDDIG